MFFISSEKLVVRAHRIGMKYHNIQAQEMKDGVTITADLTKRRYSLLTEVKKLVKDNNDATFYSDITVG